MVLSQHFYQTYFYIIISIVPPVPNTRKFIASINSLNISSIRAYKKGGFKEEAIITDNFYNKTENNIIMSDKIFVSCNNHKYDMETLKIWKPIN